MNEVAECAIVSGVYPQLVAIRGSRVSPSHDKAIGVEITFRRPLPGRSSRIASVTACVPKSG
jgi:hypothetical protein